MEESYASSVTVTNTRKQKILKREKGKEDLISKLPESLITCILSFLPTKDAVSTSLLSKKWLFRWTSLTNLDIHDCVFFYPIHKKKKTSEKHKIQNFVNFVNRALLLTNASSFSLTISYMHDIDVSLLNTWISNILTRRVKNLRIDTHFKMSFSALSSHFLFNSYSIEELVLKMDSCVIGVGKTYVYFADLKHLKLSGISFTLYSTSNLSLSLPVLKYFETTNCVWLKAKRVTLTAPLLESVIIVQDSNLSYETRNCEIEFSAKCLRDFTYRGYDNLSHSFKLQDPSSAKNASLNIAVKLGVNKDPKTESRVFVLFKQFRQMKYLKLQGSEILSQLKVGTLPSFGMLTQLEIASVTGDVLLALLQKSPVLKTLIIKGISKFDKELLNSAAVPHCFTSTLQVVKFHGVKGLEHELCLAKFVMENCLVLERMSFYHYSVGGSKVIEEFKEKLFSAKKAFFCAIVEFSYDYLSRYVPV